MSNLWIRTGVRAALLLPFLLGVHLPASPIASPAPTPAVLHFGGDCNYPPFEFLDEKGQPAGFNVDLDRAIAAVTGVTIDIQLMQWDIARQKLDQGALDAMTGMYYSPERARQVNFSRPFISVQHAIFVRNDRRSIATERDLPGKEIIIQKGDILQEYAQSHFPTARLILVNSVREGLRLLAAGQHDCLLTAKLEGLYLVRQLQVTNITIAGPPFLKTDYCIAFNKNRTAELAAFNRGLALIEQSLQLRAIKEKWFDVLDPQGIPSRTVFHYALAILVPILLILLASFFWSWTLRQQVEAKTRDLNRELAERRQAESREKQHLREVTTLLDNMPGFVFFKDIYSVFILVNKQFADALGKPQEWFPGKTDLDAFPREIAEKYRADDARMIATGEPLDVGEETLLVHGEPITIVTRKVPLRDENDNVIGLIGLAVDITERQKMEAERRELEKQIQHTQKLESLGILAGGIAHDFNNLLMGILGNAELALINVTPGSAARQRIEEIKKTGLRASELTKQMLAYSGKGQFVIEPVNLNDLIEEMSHLLQVSIFKKIAIKYNFAPNLPPIKADATQICQVVMNLITNASEAIGDKNGVISLTTGVMRADPAYLSGTFLGGAELNGRCVYLEVSDSGCGMDEKTRQRIFEPFFTTKYTGRGLGLAAVLGIVRGHKGAIRVYSEPDRGTAFKVLFPCPTDLLTMAGRQPQNSGRDWSGHGTVLVVDDEEIVRNVAKAMLEAMGLKVFTANDGHQGVEMFTQINHDLALVLLDMTMPNMNGEEAYREMRRIREGVPVILVSGYSEQDATSHFAGKGLAGFIQKPFQLVTLREKVREVLGG